jgi:hypothetical protein
VIAANPVLLTALIALLVNLSAAPAAVAAGCCSDVLQ